MTLFNEEFDLITGLDPVADAFAGTKSSDIVDMSEYDEVTFLVHIGVGATGTSTITVEACDDISASNTTAVAFYSQSDTSADTHGTLTARAAAGYTTTAGSTRREIITVKNQTLASTGYTYVRLNAVEVANSPVLGGIAIIGRKINQREPDSISAVD